MGAAIVYWEPKNEKMGAAIVYWEPKKEKRGAAIVYWEPKKEKMGAAIVYWEPKRQRDQTLANNSTWCCYSSKTCRFGNYSWKKLLNIIEIIWLDPESNTYILDDYDDYNLSRVKSTRVIRVLNQLWVKVE